jgi:uncharacterized membrane protein YgdD (TMEM256/DUF423 family)
MSWVALGAFSAMIGVAMGAFGAHALSERLGAKALSVYHTGAQYQMYHALALIAFGLWAAAHPAASARAPGWAFALGTVLFSGSLYALALTDARWLGAITPFGGLLFLIGWGAFAWQAWSARP